MGRKKIAIELIEDHKIRHVTFKKRRLGVLRKAMQLSKLTGASVELKIHWQEDDSLIEYFSNSQDDFKDLSIESSDIQEYAKFHNSHFEFVAQIDDRSNCPSTGDASDRFWYSQLKKKADELDVKCKNIIELFCLAKKSSYLAKIKKAA